MYSILRLRVDAIAKPEEKERSAATTHGLRVHMTSSNAVCGVGVRAKFEAQAASGTATPLFVIGRVIARKGTMGVDVRASIEGSTDTATPTPLAVPRHRVSAVSNVDVSTKLGAKNTSGTPTLPALTSPFADVDARGCSCTPHDSFLNSCSCTSCGDEARAQAPKQATTSIDGRADSLDRRARGKGPSVEKLRSAAPNGSGRSANQRRREGTPRMRYHAHEPWAYSLSVPTIGPTSDGGAAGYDAARGHDIKARSRSS